MARLIARRTATLRAAAVAVVLATAGCVSVDYIGKSYPPTAHVDVYLSASDVKQKYTTIGQARAQVEDIPFTNSSQQLQEKLIAEAKSRGADGVILGGLDRRQVLGSAQTVGQATTKKKGEGKKTTYTETTTQNVEDMVELRGTLIRYDR
jgi:hypothetical protein